MDEYPTDLATTGNTPATAMTTPNPESTMRGTKRKADGPSAGPSRKLPRRRLADAINKHKKGVQDNEEDEDED